MEIKQTLKLFAAALFAAVALSAMAAEPLCWERTPSRPAPAQFDTFHGDSFTQGVCSRHSIPFVSSPSWQSQGTARSVYVGPFALVVENDFPAETGSLNWSWQPT